MFILIFISILQEASLSLTLSLSHSLTLSLSLSIFSAFVRDKRRAVAESHSELYRSSSSGIAEGPPCGLCLLTCFRQSQRNGYCSPSLQSFGKCQVREIIISVSLSLSLLFDHSICSSGHPHSILTIKVGSATCFVVKVSLSLSSYHSLRLSLLTIKLGNTTFLLYSLQTPFSLSLSLSLSLLLFSLPNSKNLQPYKVLYASSLISPSSLLFSKAVKDYGGNREATRETPEGGSRRKAPLLHAPAPALSASRASNQWR